MCLLLNRNEREVPSKEQTQATATNSLSSPAGEETGAETADVEVDDVTNKQDDLAVLGSHAFFMQMLLSRCSDVSPS